MGVTKENKSNKRLKEEGSRKGWLLLTVGESLTEILSAAQYFWGHMLPLGGQLLLFTSSHMPLVPCYLQ